ncbi:MAG: RNA polymerase sigma factor [Kiritimatiellae bacterium]|nr:RNA polymerase sigma factor [Kiritimatiellia bacterium]
MNEASDAELMAQAAKGSEIAFAELVRRYQDVLLNFFLRSAVSFVDGQDLAQRTFLRLWRYRKRYKAGRAKFTTFLFMLARQESIDFFRVESRRRAQEEEIQRLAAVAAPAQGSAGPSGEAVRRAMGRLTPTLRDAVELVVFQDMPYAEAGAVLGVPLGTVKSRIFNALKRLKELLGHERGC